MFNIILAFSHVKYIIYLPTPPFSYMFMFFSFLPSSLINVTSRWLIILLIYMYICFEINLFHNISASMSFHFSSLFLVFLFSPSIYSIHILFTFSISCYCYILFYTFFYFFVYSITIIIMIFLKITFTFIDFLPNFFVVRHTLIVSQKPKPYTVCGLCYFSKFLVTH